MPEPSLPRLVLFPGLGVDARLFGAQRGVARIEVPAWPMPRRGEPLADYARRMSEQINPDPPPFLGGVSIGGMIALEASRHLPCRGVLMISACRTYRSLPRWLRALGRLAPWVPRPVIGSTLHLTPLALKILREPTTRAQAHFIRRMFLDHDPVLVQWGLRAIASWSFDGTPTVPVHHVHGDADHCIPIRNVVADRAVPGGGHLINVTHPAEVNAFLREAMGSHIENN